MSVIEGVDPNNLSESGWGVIFAHDPQHSDHQIREALRPLLDLRQQQAGALYREFAGADAPRPREATWRYLARLGVGPGPARPDRVPYYLLLVGHPEIVPFDFVMRIDVQYAVGRIYFETIDEYARYARSVVDRELATPPALHRLGVFGVRHHHDRYTRALCEDVVGKLPARLSGQAGWQLEVVASTETTKERLTRLLHHTPAPDLLMTAGHGVSFPSGSPLQQRQQGALLCRDWPGPLEWTTGDPIPTDYYFGADDLKDGARVHGSIVFQLGSYGLGTPRLDDFARQATGKVVELAPRSFVARFAQRLLAHPNGGALAMLGQVGRAWTSSLAIDAISGTYTDVLRRVMLGQRVGHALDVVNEHHAELSLDLLDDLRQEESNRNPSLESASMWMMMNELRSIHIFGDPAVRLPVDRPSVA